MPSILWPDVEATLLAYLRPAIADSSLAFASDVEVRDVLDNPRPQYAVTVRNDGGPPVETVFADVRVGINVWAPTKAEAVDLAAVVTALVNGIPESGLTPFIGATCGMAYAIADESGQPHLYMAPSLRIRGIDL